MGRRKRPSRGIGMEGNMVGRLMEEGAREVKER
jgi:hypothetical protein